MHWLGSYALPSASDKQVVIDNLPSVGGLDPLFHGGFVYWSLPETDSAIYRCALPACAGGPERMGSWHKDTWLSGEGDLIFWLQGDGFIHRAAQLGGSPAQRLLPDQTLREAVAGDVLDPSRENAGLIATSLGELYACLQSTGWECGCTPSLSSGSDCVASVVRWPVEGGARETIVRLEERVSRLFVFEKELAWVSRHADDTGLGTLSSCRVEACAATRRDLGQVDSSFGGLASDEHHLYWLEIALNRHSGPSQIRRVARLAAP